MFSNFSNCKCTNCTNAKCECNNTHVLHCNDTLVFSYADIFKVTWNLQRKHCTYDRSAKEVSLLQQNELSCSWFRWTRVRYIPAVPWVPVWSWEESSGCARPARRQRTWRFEELWFVFSLSQEIFWCWLWPHRRPMASDASWDLLNTSITPSRWSTLSADTGLKQSYMDLVMGS